jgi:hypothetical protein
VLRSVISANSGGRDQVDQVRGQPGQLVHDFLSRKNSSPKRTDGEAQGVCPGFKPQ